MNNYYMIKQWCTETGKWVPTYYYINKPHLPRTIGYMNQRNINALPEKKDIITKVYRAKL